MLEVLEEFCSGSLTISRTVLNSCPAGDRPFVRIRKLVLPARELSGVSSDAISVECRIRRKAAGIFGHGSKYGASPEGISDQSIRSVMMGTHMMGFLKGPACLSSHPLTRTDPRRMFDGMPVEPHPSDSDRLDAIRRHTHATLRYYATASLHETGENRDWMRALPRS